MEHDGLKAGAQKPRRVRSLFSRLAATLILVLALLGVAQYFLGHWLLDQYRDESDQNLHTMVASQLAAKLERSTSGTIDYGELDRVLSEATRINPQIEIYIVGHDGNLLAWSGRMRPIFNFQVDVEPIRRFIHDPTVTYPLYGTSPRDEKGMRIFSAAPLRFGEESVYLYVILSSVSQQITYQGLITKHATLASVGLLVLSLTVAAIIALAAFSWITKRLTRMTKSVERFEQGDLTERITDRSDDEVGKLARTFNVMASTIEAHIEALNQKDQLRRELIANVSHDLRGPITSISGFLETLLMKGNELPPESRERYTRIALAGVESLNRLIQELFELSKFEAREVVPSMAPVDLSDLVLSLEAKFTPLAAQRTVRIITAVAPHGAQVALCDLAMIERALSNLAENAIRYTPEGGQVTIGVEDCGERLRIFVSDTGVGIDEEDLPRIFDQFFRAKRTQRKDMPGTGLGLAIVRKIIEAHNSAIDVASKPNEGTRFSFSLGRAEVSAVSPSIDPRLTLH